MSGDYRRELGLLRSLVGAVEFRPPIPPQQFNQSYLQAERIAVAQAVNDGVITVRAPAGKSFEELCGCVVGRSPQMERGTKFTEVRTQVLKELRSFIGRASSSITLDDAASFQARLDDWFSGRVAVRRIFVPCFISPWRAPRFEIGPAQFVFAADATKTGLYPAADDLISKDGFDRLLDLANASKADWLACVTIEGCERERAEELGGLAVDLATVGLQLSIPLAFEWLFHRAGREHQRDAVALGVPRKLNRKRRTVFAPFGYRQLTGIRDQRPPADTCDHAQASLQSSSLNRLFEPDLAKQMDGF